ncbi:MAG TPA: TonB-dependent receptor [Terracidiphilus sp.]|nr:TonB-dependent receptor [Terracidiphilus sp.]
MARLRLVNISLCCALIWLCASISSWASEYHGQVLFDGVPVPGATVTVTQGDKRFTAVTDRQGLYEFADLADGQWKIEIEMSGFSRLDDKVSVAPNAPQGNWELKLLGLEQMLAQAQESKPLKTRPAAETKAASNEEAQKAADTNVPTALPAPDDAADKSADGLLIVGSENNAATSQYSLSPAFGNRRPGAKGLYTGSVGAIVDNSVFNARPYSLTGQQTPKDFYSRVTTVVTLGGPLRIPRLMPVGPNFFVAYQWTRNGDSAIQTGLVPDAAERSGNLSGVLNAQGQPVTIYNPATGVPFTGNIPVSSQASALLNLYPQPNLAGNSRYNYQAAVPNNTHTDSLQSRLNKTIGHRDQLFGGFAFRSSRADSTNLFNFVDATNSLGIDTNVNWSHRYRHQTFVLLGYHLTRLRTGVHPAFEDHVNVSGQAGIGGNDPDPANWGPPGLTFSSGIAGLSDANSSFNRNRTDAMSVNVSTNYRRHNFVFGGDFRRQEFNEFGQQNPRGTFAFTGAATQVGGSSSSGGASTTTGSDLADFLLGIPDTSAISFGNPNKYFRQSVYDLYFTDDWRMLPQLTVNAGMRWDYGAPMTELFGRLVNLDVSQGFTSVAPVLANSPKGSVSGISYPSSLVHPDKRGLEPRIGISWRPIPASTLVVRAGYGIYDDTSVYLGAVESMAEQAPFATSLSEANSSACKLTLGNGFQPCVGGAADTFAIDPNLRVGYAQNWQLSVQRDLPWALVITATYLGTKGTHGMQEFLPNTYPIGGTNLCPTCQTGFVYRTSGGYSTREAGQFQLRRRLRSGFTASVDYTWAKAMDNDAQIGAQGHVTATTASTSQAGAGPTVAQNWRDLRAERGLSTFDQRQLLNSQLQYTTGMGMGGRTLMSGWRGRLLKEWTVVSQISTGTGLPETPIFLAAVPGTGMTGTIRPNLTGAPIYSAASGYHLNVAAFSAPTAGAWGTARRNSITGPDQFSLNGSMSRTFRLRNPFNLDVRIDTINLLNHGVFTAWNTVVNSTTFGLPGSSNPMRSLQVTGRLRF